MSDPISGPDTGRDRSPAARDGTRSVKSGQARSEPDKSERERRVVEGLDGGLSMAEIPGARRRSTESPDPAARLGDSLSQREGGERAEPECAATPWKVPIREPDDAGPLSPSPHEDWAARLRGRFGLDFRSDRVPRRSRSARTKSGPARNRRAPQPAGKSGFASRDGAGALVPGRRSGGAAPHGSGGMRSTWPG